MAKLGWVHTYTGDHCLPEQSLRPETGRKYYHGDKSSDQPALSALADVCTIFDKTKVWKKEKIETVVADRLRVMEFWRQVYSVRNVLDVSDYLCYLRLELELDLELPSHRG